MLNKHKTSLSEEGEESAPLITAAAPPSVIVPPSSAPSIGNVEEYFERSADISQANQLRSWQKWTLILSSLMFVLLPIFHLVYDASFSVSKNDIIVYLPYIVLHVFYTVLLIAMAYHRKHMQPFRSRCMFLLLVSTAAGFLLRIWVLAVDWVIVVDGPCTCQITKWIVDICYPGLSLPYLLRAYRLYLIFNTRAKDCNSSFSVKALSAPSKEEDLDATKSFVRYIPRPTDWVFQDLRQYAAKLGGYGTCQLAAWLALAMIPPIAFAFVEQFTQFHVSPAFAGCPKGSAVFSLIYHVVEAVLFAMSIKFIRNAWEEFDLRIELMMVFWFDVAVVIIQAVDVVVDGGLGDVYQQWLFSLRCSLFFVVSIALPLHQTYNPLTGVHTKVIEEDTLKRIEGILSNSQLFTAFSHFMDEMDAGELLEFYMKVHFYRELDDPSLRTTAARALHQSFLLAAPTMAKPATPNRRLGISELLDSRPQRVSQIIPPYMVDEIDDLLKYGPEVPSESLFDSAQETVVTAMRRVYMERFKQTEEYRKLVKQVKTQRVMHARLLQSDMLYYFGD